MGFIKPPSIDELKEKKDIKGLIKVFDGHYAYRERVLSALVNIGDSEAIEAIISRLKVKPTGIEAAYFVKTLIEIGDASAEPLITGLVRTGLILGSSINACATYDLAKGTLIEIGDAAIDLLIQAIKEDTRHRIRVFALEVFLGIASSKFLESRTDQIWEILKDDKNMSVKTNLTILFSEIANAKLYKPLVHLLEEGYARAVEGLGKIGDENAVDPIIQHLENLKWFERSSKLWPLYIQALINIGKPAEASLKESLNCKKKHVRKIAEKALKEISKAGHSKNS